MLTHIYIYIHPHAHHTTHRHTTHTQEHHIELTLHWHSSQWRFLSVKRIIALAQLNWYTHFLVILRVIITHCISQCISYLLSLHVLTFFFQITKYCLPDASEAHLNSADFVGVVKLVIFLHLCTSLWWGEKGLGVRQTYFCIYSQYRDKTKQKQ